MNFSKLGLIVGAMVGMAGCLQLSVNEPNASDSQAVSFDLTPAFSSFESNVPASVRAAVPSFAAVCANPNEWSTYQTLGLPNSYQLPVESTTTNFDFSSALADTSVVDVSYSVLVNGLSIDNPNNEFGFVTSIEVDMVGSDAAHYPPIVLAQYTAPDAGVSSELNVSVVMPSSQILSYLKAGQVTLTVKLVSSPITLAQACALVPADGGTPTLNSNVNMSVAVSATATKSL